MTHFRRYEFKKRRFCSTPSVANLHDFSDHFVEDLENKIRLVKGRENGKLDGLKEAGEDESSLDVFLNESMQLSSDGDSRAKEKSEPSDSVFKSANWVSDSELIFSLSNQVGGLVRALRIFEEVGIGIKHVESRKSRRRDSEFEIFVDIDCNDQEKMKKLVHHLRHEVDCLTKEEFERAPSLIRQNSQIHSPLSVSSSSNLNSELARLPEVGDQTSTDAKGRVPAADCNGNNARQALALMAQPSVDYGALCASQSAIDSKTNKQVTLSSWLNWAK